MERILDQRQHWPCFYFRKQTEANRSKAKDNDLLQPTPSSYPNKSSRENSFTDRAHVTDDEKAHVIDDVEAHSTTKAHSRQRQVVKYAAHFQSSASAPHPISACSCSSSRPLSCHHHSTGACPYGSTQG